MNVDSNHISVIVCHLQKALTGEPLPDPLGSETRTLLDALRAVIMQPDPGVKDAALHQIALTSLHGLNTRLRVAITSAKALETARRH